MQVEQCDKQSRCRLKSILFKMHDRCENENNINYYRYGKRGITVCDEWVWSSQGINNFILWSINNGYGVNLEIDRIDNEGVYCPNNCRWISHKENCNNKSDNRIVTYMDKDYTISEFAETFDINRNTLIGRLNRGINIEDVLFYEKDNSVLCKKVYQYDKDNNFIAEYNSITQCAKELNTQEVCISRVCNGYRKTHRGFKFKFEGEEN